jgi:hypothetical protein
MLRLDKGDHLQARQLLVRCYMDQGETQKARAAVEAALAAEAEAGAGAGGRSDSDRKESDSDSDADADADADATGQGQGQGQGGAACCFYYTRALIEFIAHFLLQVRACVCVCVFLRVLPLQTLTTLPPLSLHPPSLPSSLLLKQTH